MHGPPFRRALLCLGYEASKQVTGAPAATPPAQRGSLPESERRGKLLMSRRFLGSHEVSASWLHGWLA